MTSDTGTRGVAARAILSLPLIFALGCWGSVHDESVSSKPLVVIHGHVDAAALIRSHPGVPLLGVLVWAAVPTVNPLCIQFSTPELRSACPDPFGVFWGQVDRAAIVGDDGTFTLEIYSLPKASVSVGDQITRIAYGSLIVLEDVNGDGQPTLPAPPIDTGGDRRGGQDRPTSIPADADVLVAATFHTLLAQQARVVFREGGFVEGSNFYPSPGCAAPPRGFSIQSVPPYSDGVPARGGCATRDIGLPLEIPALPTEQAFAFTCRALQQGSQVRQPDGDRQPFGGALSVCLSNEILASITPGTCPHLTAYALKSCETDPLCAQPDWDQTSAPPSWWPCP